LAFVDWGRESVVLQSTTRSRAEAHHFPLAATILIPAVALVLQFSLPIYFPAAAMADLPLLVVIYLSLTQRSPVGGLLSGALIGVVQDSLSRDAIGLYAISNTVTGYVTSVISSRMETEMPGIRLVIVFVLYYLHFFCRYALGEALLGQTIDISLVTLLYGSLVNALLGMLLFLLLDRFRKAA